MMMMMKVTNIYKHEKTILVLNYFLKNAGAAYKEGQRGLEPPHFLRFTK